MMKELEKEFSSYPRPTSITEQMASAWKVLMQVHIQCAKENKNIEVETGIKNSKKKVILPSLNCFCQWKTCDLIQ